MDNKRFYTEPDIPVSTSVSIRYMTTSAGKSTSGLCDNLSFHLLEPTTRTCHNLLG